VAKKNHRTLNRLGLRSSVLAVASCLALSAIPLTAQAAGLGKVVVFSALGQPLRAEIEVTATREELSDMKAQLASKNAFQQAGLDYASALQSIRFSIDKRPSGKTVINLVSSAPINDPFIDMLLELNWPTGRLVREYTFLLDPPEVTARNAAKVAPVAVSKPEISVDKPASSVQTSTAVADEPRAKTTPPKARVQEAPAKPVEQAADSSESREVKRGDTLSKIAGATKPEGVSLEQMLVGLFRANQEAFDGGNMNRLKTGKILSIPEKSALEAVSSGEARKIVIAQSSDWNAYRSKLAAVAAQTPVKEGGAKQEVAGKITAKVEEKVSGSTEPKDQLKVSKTDTSNTKYGAAAKRSEEDLIAKEKALKEANERLVSLEKNVVNLQKLLDLKSQNLAELQQRATEKTASVEANKPEVAKPQPPSAPVAPVVAPEPVPVAPTPIVEKPAEAKVLEKPVEVGVKPAEAPVAEQKPADMPKPKPRPAPPPPPPEEEPGFVEELLDNPIALAGGGGVLALIAAYAVIRRRRAGKGEAPLDLSSTMTPTSDSLTANSVFRSTGGQSVDTSHTPVQTDFSQAGPGSIDTDEVDPVAEADVYMAYGRDAQAEEILLEAKQKDPTRFAIHLKLLEIYTNRKDTKQFESLASDIYAETGGVGADWEKAVSMGLKLDPSNPLFGGAASSAPAPFDADATVIVSAQSMRNTVTLPGELSQLAEEASSTTDFSLPVAEPAVENDLASLDFDLGLGAAEESAPQEQEKIDPDATLRLPDPVVVDTGPLDFDLAMPSLEATKIAPIGVTQEVSGLDFNLEEVTSSKTPQVEINKEMNDLDFDLGTEIGGAPEAIEAPEVFAQAETVVVPEPFRTDDDGVEFDVSLTESTFLGRSIPESTFNMSSIDLDLNAPEIPDSAPILEVAPESTPVKEVVAAVDDKLSDLEFDAAQLSTQVNADFSTAQAETVVNPQFGLEQDLAPDFEISVNEEVATKLDLAKAYEEMGDLEGARELLQEVVKEGDASQKDAAQLILAKIGT